MHGYFKKYTAILGAARGGMEVSMRNLELMISSIHHSISETFLRHWDSFVCYTLLSMTSVICCDICGLSNNNNDN